MPERPPAPEPDGPAVPDPASPLRDPAADTLPEAAIGAGADDLVIQGHTYDGIREYDNPMPGWWVGLFWAGIVFAPLYVLGVHAFGWIDTYEDDFAEAGVHLEEVRAVYAATGPAFKTDDGALRAYAADPAFAAAGAATFAATCATCHGPLGEGLVGPNLTDPYWVHGGTPGDIYRVISEGVPEKGMPPWDGALSEEEQAQTMAYIVSIQGSEPPNAKEPEGEPAL